MMMENIINTILGKFMLLFSSEAGSADALQDITFNFALVTEANAWILSGIGYTIVFIALVVLMYAIISLSKIFVAVQRKELRKIDHPKKDQEDLSIPQDINAAIAMALYLHFEEAHDEESGVLTIDQVQRRYSPWSSKIYNMSPISNRKW